MDLISLTRKDIFLMIRDLGNADYSDKLSAIEKAIKLKFNVQFPLSKESADSLRPVVTKIKEKWRLAYRNLSKFYKKNELWLNGILQLKLDLSSTHISPENTPVVPVKAAEPSTSQNVGTKRGRPSKDFEEGSDRTKRRKASELADSHPTTQLVYATEMSLRRSGFSDAAAVLKEVFVSSPGSATKMREAPTTSPLCEMPAEEALALMVNTSSTVDDYQKYRSVARQYNAPIFPAYKKILDAKRECYPEDMRISETCAYVPLQNLLDHTVQRLLTLQFEVICNVNQEMVENLQLYVKWACNGSSGQSQYKQSFTNSEVSDASMFMTSLAPLRLVSSNSQSANTFVIWKNARPSSPRYCRPITIEFMVENADSIIKEKARIDKELECLKPYETYLDGKKITVNYKLFFTMIDGKVCNAVTDTKSAMRCYLCDITSKDFNKIDFVLSKPVNESYLCYGMSTLHAWIIFMECILHIGYRITVRNWQARGADKVVVEQRKKNIHEGLKNKLSLIVDIPKQGAGTTNDENTARRFFGSSETVSVITGVDLKLIQRFYHILQVLSCGFAVNIEAFSNYCFETARLYVDLYPWYNMPTSLHKVLIHGSQILEAAELPIGELFEDAQEARNKDFRKYRESYSRKISREKTMEDVFHWLLASSDPVISGKRKFRTKKGKQLSKEALKLLASGEFSDCSSDESESEFSEKPSSSSTS